MATILKSSAEQARIHDTRSSSLGYQGYPKSICTSVNDEVVHGIPSDGSYSAHFGHTIAITEGDAMILTQ